MSEILFRDVLLLDGEMEQARRADLLIGGGKILQIQEPGVIQAGNAEVFEGRGATAVLPGFVNGHTHLSMALLRGLGENLPLDLWLKERIWPAEKYLTPEMVRLGARAAIAEMIAGGVTGTADMYFFMDQVLRASDELGIRCALGVSCLGKELQKVDEALELAELCEARGNGRSKAFFAPHAPYTVSPELLKAIGAAAKSAHLGVQFHFLESSDERRYIQEAFHQDPVCYLAEAGLLEASSLVLAHGVQLTQEDLRSLALPNVTVVHNPASNLKLGNGVAPLPEMLNHGINVSLGTDSAASNNRLDLWAEMRLAALLHKGISGDPTVISPRQILKCATYGGARSLGFTRVGFLRPQWKADLAVIDLSKMHYIGVNETNLAEYIVYAGSSADVIGTLCEGRWLFREGRLLTADQDQIADEARAARSSLLKNL